MIDPIRNLVLVVFSTASSKFAFPNPLEYKIFPFCEANMAPKNFCFWTNGSKYELICSEKIDKDHLSLEIYSRPFILRIKMEMNKPSKNLPLQTARGTVLQVKRNFWP